MKKKFLTLLGGALLGLFSMNASAQTWVDVTSTYLTNPDFEGDYEVLRYLGEKNSNDRAIYKPEGWTVVTENENLNDMTVLKSGDLSSGTFSGFNLAHSGSQTYWVRHRWGGQVWKSSGTTGSPTSLELQQEISLPNGVYRLSADLMCYASGTEANDHVYLKAGTQKVEPTIYHAKSDNNWENKSLIVFASGKSNVTIGLQALQTWQCELISGFDNVKLERYNVSEENPYDLTDFVGNDKASWTGGSGTYSNCVEHFIWGGTATGEYLSQTVSNLPIGMYEVELYCAASSTSSRDNGGATLIDPDGSEDYVTINANDVTMKIPAYNRTDVVGDIPSYKLEDVTVSDGTLKLSVNIVKANPNWIVANIKSLKYFGVDLSMYVNALSAALTTARGIDQSALPTAVTTVLAAAIQQGEDADTNDQESLEDAIGALNDAIAMVNNVAGPYKALTDLIAICNEIKDNSEPESADAKTTFDAAITAADASDETTAEAIDAIIATLESARQTYVKVADPINGKAFDYTFIIANPSFEEGNTNGWTVKGGSDVGAKENANATYTMTNADGAYLFNIWGGSTPHAISQDVSVPRDGLYELSAVLASDANTELSLQLGTETTNVKITADKGTGTVYTTGQVSAANKTTIGVSSNGWYKADNFRLMFYGFDKAAAVDALEDLATSAEAITGKMNTAVAGALADAIGGAGDITTSNTKAEITEATTALQEAMEAAQSSVEAYAKVKAALDGASTTVSTFDDAGKAAYDVTDIAAAYENGTIEGDGSAEIQAINAAVRAAAVAQAAGANLTFLMVNPSFEDGTTGWENKKNTTGTYDYRTDDTNPAHGSKTLNAWAQQVNYINVWQKVTLPAGNYSLSASLRTNAEPLENKTQIRTYVNGTETSHSAGLTYTPAEYDWNSMDAWQTLTTTFTLTEETEVEMGVYSTGKNINNNSQGWFQVDNFKLTYLGDASANMTVAVADGVNWGTFVAPFDVTIPNGVKAYTCDAVEGDVITTTEVETTIPANTPVLVYSEAAVSKTFYGKADAEDTPSYGVMFGTYEAKAAPVGSYVLQKNNDVFSFYKVGNSVQPTIGANRCYIVKNSGSTMLRFGGATNIQSMEQRGESVIYDLTGRRVDAAVKGIYIVNGKKMLVK